MSGAIAGTIYYKGQLIITGRVTEMKSFYVAPVIDGQLVKWVIEGLSLTPVVV